jgi:hypothetical protein
MYDEALQQAISERLHEFSKIAGCILILGLSFVLPFEVQRGSLVLAMVSQKGDYVVVAAESRNQGMNHELLDDRACKIISLGDDTVFFETGNAVNGLTHGTNWNALKTARAVYRASKMHDAKSLSVIWGNDALKWFQGQATQNLQLIADKNGGLVTGGFVNFIKTDRPSVQSRTIFYSESAHIVGQQPEGEPPKLGQISTTGVAVDLVWEFFKGNTTRAAIAFGPIGSIRRIGEDSTIDASLATKSIHFAMDNSTGTDHDAIGGLIEVAIVRKNLPIEWVTRKKECYEQDQKPILPAPSP